VTCTLVLAERPFRDLTSRAVLEEAVAALDLRTPVLLSTSVAAPPGFEAVAPGTLPDDVGLVVLAGVFLDRGLLDQALATAVAAVARGARLCARGLGLEGRAAAIRPPEEVAVLSRAESIAVRDHRSASVLTLWRVAAPIRLLSYPERHVAPDPTLAATLQAGPILGLSLRGGEEMRRAWLPRLGAIGAELDAAKGWSVLPLPTFPTGAPDDERPAVAEIAAALLPGAPLLLPALAESVFWRRQVTPARLKALVARCALVVTNRDLIAGYAVASGVALRGLALGADRRIVSCMATLANALPAGSALLHPKG
jgi:hypothetical protein